MPNLYQQWTAMTASSPTWCRTAEHQKPTCACLRIVSHLGASPGVPHFLCPYTLTGKRRQRHPKFPSWNAAPAKFNKTLTWLRMKFWVFNLYFNFDSSLFHFFNSPTLNRPWTLTWVFILTEAYFYRLKMVGQKNYLYHSTSTFLHSSKYPAMRLCNSFRSYSEPLLLKSSPDLQPNLHCHMLSKLFLPLLHSGYEKMWLLSFTWKSLTCE